MPSLPSQIARYDSVDLLDLDELPPSIAVRPRGARLLAWAKLEELERRWTMFDWGTFVIVTPHRNTLLLRDLASAYLLTFEATIQILLEERRFDNLEQWLRSHVSYDVACRGIRTLRHLEAHVRAGDLSTNTAGTMYSRFAHTHVGGTVAWRWPTLSEAELAQVRSKNSKLATEELSEWNRIADEVPALEIMRHGVVALSELLAAAEAGAV